MIAAGSAASAVAEVFHAVGGELRLLDGSVVGVLHGLGVVRGVHHVEVVIAREDHGLIVGRDRGPGRLALGRFVEQREFARRQFVLEGELLLIASRRRREISAAASAQLLLRFVARIFRVVLLLVAGAIGGRRGPGDFFSPGITASRGTLTSN